jgi:hypothetical protein
MPPTNMTTIVLSACVCGGGGGGGGLCVGLCVWIMSRIYIYITSIICMLCVCEMCICIDKFLP